MNYNHIHIVLFCVITMVACQSKKSPQTNKTEANYTQQHRLQYHFSPPQQWMNDPNGMVFYDGEYHLFYQHYPDSNVWGPMHWGHAVSTDMINWENLPIALYPDTLGYIFSGSAVVDWNNTAGFQQGDEPALIAIYTYHLMEGERAGHHDFQTQGIAYSHDKGRTWTKYEGNPVIPNTENIRDFRDPKVFWHEPTMQWVMVLAMGDRVRIYNSKNLKAWAVASEFGPNVGSEGRPWECPDLFELPIEGTTNSKWVMLVSLGRGGANGGSATQYFIGDFDGKTFTLDPALAASYAEVPSVVPKGVVFENFENDYSNWTATGTAFGNAPAKGALVGQQNIEGVEGSALVNSFKNGDKTTGKLTSKSFTIKQNYINFKIGGGSHQAKTCINLVIDNEVVRSKTGADRESLKWAAWDVRELKGKTASITIVDAHDAGWGHINVDQIVFADEPAKPARHQTLWVDYGRDNYAGVTFSDIPQEDDRRIFMGWMSNWQYAQIVPTYDWRSAMTLPRTLTLYHTDSGLRLSSKVVKEMKQLRSGETYILDNQTIEKTIDLTSTLNFNPAMMEVQLNFSVSKGATFGIMCSNSKGETYKLCYNDATQQFVSDRTQSGKVNFSDVFAAQLHTAPRATTGKTIAMHLFFDVASIELFADNGTSVLTDIFFPNEDFNQISLFVENGTATIEKGLFYELKSIWR